jgi:hypothetical protein
VFVIALAAVTLIQRSVAGELGAVARDLAGSSAPKAHAARELSASQLVERRALAEADRLLADQQAAADRALAQRRAGGPAAAGRLAGQATAPAGDRLEQLLRQLSETAGRDLDADRARAERATAVTTSVGVASGVEDGWEGLVRRADTGLYAAKEGGRDRVVAGPPAGSRPFTPEGQDAARYR